MRDMPVVTIVCPYRDRIASVDAWSQSLVRLGCCVIPPEFYHIPEYSKRDSYKYVRMAEMSKSIALSAKTHFQKIRMADAVLAILPCASIPLEKRGLSFWDYIFYAVSLHKAIYFSHPLSDTCSCWFRNVVAIEVQGTGVYAFESYTRNRVGKLVSVEFSTNGNENEVVPVVEGVHDWRLVYDLITINKGLL